MLRQYFERIPWPVAATSWVWPAPLADNCRRLRGVFDEVALLLLETAPCLAYGQGDLPSDLAGAGLSYHVHLPLDMPWGDPAQTARIAAGLADKTAYLDPWGFVLHPPASPDALDAFASAWLGLGRDPAAIVLENAGTGPFAAHWPVIEARGFGVCLDLGHVLAYDDKAMLAIPALFRRVRLLHLAAPLEQAAPGPGADKHLPLTRLGPKTRELIAWTLARLSPKARIVLEVFDPDGLFASVAVLAELCRQAAPARSRS